MCPRSRRTSPSLFLFIVRNPFLKSESSRCELVAKQRAQLSKQHRIAENCMFLPLPIAVLYSPSASPAGRALPDRTREAAWLLMPAVLPSSLALRVGSTSSPSQIASALRCSGFRSSKAMPIPRPDCEYTTIPVASNLRLPSRMVMRTFEPALKGTSVSTKQPPGPRSVVRVEKTAVRPDLHHFRRRDKRVPARPAPFRLACGCSSFRFVITVVHAFTTCQGKLLFRTLAACRPTC